jgi:hypothetical protein
MSSELYQKFLKENLARLKKSYTGYGYDFEKYLKNHYIKWLEKKVERVKDEQ